MAESDTKAKSGREGKTMIGAYADKDGAYAVQEVLLKLSRERRVKVTMQEAILEALTDFCKKHGVDVKL